MNVVIKVDEQTKEKMIEYYKDKLRDKTPPYAIFQAQDMDTIITMYNSGKVMFQGLSADIDANMWSELAESTNNKENDIEKYNYDNLASHILGYIGKISEKEYLEYLKFQIIKYHFHLIGLFLFLLLLSYLDISHNF